MMDDSTPDPIEVLAALSVRDVTAAVRVTGGMDTLVWRVESGGRAFALRLFRAEQVETSRREVAAIGIARAGRVPVPPIETVGRWGDRPAMLMAWAPGRTLVDEIGAHPWRVWALGRRFGRVQRRINALAAGDALPSRDWAGWARAESPTVTERLERLALGHKQLVHLDYHPLNVLAGGGRITAVLDWSNAGAGDPRADAARTEMLLSLSPAPGARLPHIRLVRALLVAAWRRGYGAEDATTADKALFRSSAASTLANDMAPRIGRPGVWFQQADIDRIRTAARTWERRAHMRT